MMALWEVRWFENQLPAAAVDILNRVKFVSTKGDAAALLQQLADLYEKELDLTPQRAMHEAKVDVGYFAGYFDHSERDRIERLFGTEHPVFGSIENNGEPSPTEALRIGIEFGERARRSQGSG